MVKTCRRDMVLITTSFEAIGAQALLERLAKLGSSVGAWAALTDGQSSLSRVDRKLMMVGFCAKAGAYRGAGAGASP
jgi:hypothetical protein